MSFTHLALFLSWIAIVLLALAMAGLLRQVGELMRRLDNPGVEVEPAGPRVIGELAELNLPHERSIVLFAADGCKACHEILPAFEQLSAGHTAFNFILIFDGDPVSSNRTGLQVLTGMATVFVRLRIPVTPFAVVTDATQTVVQAAPVGSTQLLRTFVATAEGVDDEAAA